MLHVNRYSFVLGLYNLSNTFYVMGSFEYIAIPTPPRHIFFNVRVIVLLNHFNEQRITSFCINVTGINFVFACIMVFNQLFLNMCMIVLIFIPS